MKHFLLTASALVFGAVYGSLAHANEPVRVGATYLTSGLDPSKGSNGWALVSHGVGEGLFSVNEQGVLSPHLAKGAERIDEHNWKILLDPERKFADGSPVTAAALAKGFENTTAKNKASLATGGALKFEPLDDWTLKVTTEKPVALIQALFAEWPLMAYGLKDDGAPLFTGPYDVENFTPDTSIDLKPNPYFPGAEKRSPVAFKRFGDAQAMTLAYEAGELDIAFGLPSEVISRLKSDPDLTIKSFPVGYQYFAILNTSRPAMADVKVRQAIDLGVDRNQLVAAINGGTPATGAFAPYFPFAEKTPRQNDPQKAASLLDEAGWKAVANGKREKDGKPLQVKIITYPQRPDLVTLLPVVKADLEKLGFSVDTQVVENINDAGAEGDFDIGLWAQHTAPTGDPAFFYNSMLQSGAALNYARYANPAFDAILQKFATTGDAAERAAIAHEAQVKVFEDAPMSFLVSPDWHVGLSKRMENYRPWGSDYYVLRADIGEKN